MNKVIATAAIKGSIHTPSMSPHLPITLEQIAEEAIKVFEAGGTVTHIHVRDPETGVPTADQDAYREIAGKVKKAMRSKWQRSSESPGSSVLSRPLPPRAETS